MKAVYMTGFGRRPFLKLPAFLIALSLMIPAISHSQPPTPTYIVNCSGTLAAWRSDTSMKNFMRNHDCVCVRQDRAPVCTPRDSGGKSTGHKKSPSGSGYSSKQDFQMQMFQGLIGAFMQGLMQGGASQPQETVTGKVVLTWSPEEEARMKAHIQKMKDEMEEEFRKELDSVKKGLKGREDAGADKGHVKSHSKTLAQLNCSAYWGIKAARSAFDAPSVSPGLDGADEFARLYGEYSAQASGAAGGSGCPEVKVDIPEVSSSGADSTFQSKMYEFIVSEIDIVIQDIRIFKERKRFAESAISAKQSEVKELESKRASAATPDEKSKIDTLLQEALDALNEAKAEDARATEELKARDQKLTALQKMYSYYQKEDAGQK